MQEYRVWVRNIATGKEMNVPVFANSELGAKDAAERMMGGNWQVTEIGRVHDGK